MNRKGIILAGGLGTRLFPATSCISKQLLPIYDKPMVYYPLSILMIANIRDILIITTENDAPLFQKLLNDGSQFGINLSYQIQDKPDGIAKAFIIGEKFIGNSNVALILGDNLFYGNNLIQRLSRAHSNKNGATIFTYHVNNPSDYGVAEIKDNKVINIQEKPKLPKSNYAVTGLYFYDNNVVNYAKKLTPSLRGELEISDLNNIYIKNNNLYVEKLGRGDAWLDTGTHNSLLEASLFISTIENRQGLKIACLEEIGFEKGWISKKNLSKQAKKYKNNQYGKYLNSLLNK